MEVEWSAWDVTFRYGAWTQLAFTLPILIPALVAWAAVMLITGMLPAWTVLATAIFASAIFLRPASASERQEITVDAVSVRISGPRKVLWGAINIPVRTVPLRSVARAEQHRFAVRVYDEDGRCVLRLPVLVHAHGEMLVRVLREFSEAARARAVATDGLEPGGAEVRALVQRLRAREPS